MTFDRMTRERFEPQKMENTKTKERRAVVKLKEPEGNKVYALARLEGTKDKEVWVTNGRRYTPKGIATFLKANIKEGWYDITLSEEVHDELYDLVSKL